MVRAGRLEVFGKHIGQLIHTMGLANELIAQEHNNLSQSNPTDVRDISAIRRAAGAKGKETRKARAAAGGRY
jgi:hypothetical protein